MNLRRYVLNTFNILSEEIGFDTHAQRKMKNGGGREETRSGQTGTNVRHLYACMCTQIQNIRLENYLSIYKCVRLVYILTGL